MRVFSCVVTTTTDANVGTVRERGTGGQQDSMESDRMSDFNTRPWRARQAPIPQLTPNRPPGARSTTIANTSECDDGNLTDNDGCARNCRLPGCGNGIIENGEQCDDGNLVDGDGCESNCTV